MEYLLIVLILGGVILLHEGGHFLAMKRLGIPVRCFSLGFGPRVWARRHRGVEYRLSLIPLGGYVLPELEAEEDWYRVPARRRILVALAGPLANLLTAVLFLVVPSTMALGVSLESLLLRPLLLTATLLGKVVAAVPLMFTRPDLLSGPVGIVSQGAAQVGALPEALTFAALISVNLAVLNLLPLPPLDGGRILLTLLERLHPRLTRLHVPLSLLGWALLLGLMVYLTGNELLQLREPALS